VRRIKMVEYYVHMYVNGKTRPVESIPGMGKGEVKRMMKRVNSTIMY
jgi:hypothetical protein